MNRIVIIGAGGHARSVIDILQQQQIYEIAGCLDPSYETQKWVEHMEDIPILGDDSLIPELRNMGIRTVFVALGDNLTRSKLIEKAECFNLELASAISPNAYISNRVAIGPGSCVMAGAVINVNCRIGKGAIINTNASVDHDCVVEDYVHIAPGTAVSGNTRIGQGSHVGTGSSIIDGITIGRWSYVGAGAVVVADLPSGVMAYGVPATVIRKYK